MQIYNTEMNRIDQTETIDLDTFPYRENDKGDMFMLNISRNLHMSFAALGHLSEGLRACVCAHAGGRAFAFARMHAHVTQHNVELIRLCGLV